MFSDHFKHSIKALGLIVALLLGVYFWLAHKVAGMRNPTHRIANLLPKNDKELIHYD
jgi:hypothetical protein